jgi:flagellar protein FlaG
MIWTTTTRVKQKVDIMSSELSVKAISIVQPPTQDAVSKRSNVESSVSKVSSLNAKASVGAVTGKALPTPGSDVPAAVSELDTPKAQQNLSSEEVLEAVQNLNDFVQKTRRELNFSVDEQTGRTVVKVIDHETKDIIRQIPAEEILEVARRVAEENDEKGNLLKVKV